MKSFISRTDNSPAGATLKQVLEITIASRWMPTDMQPTQVTYSNNQLVFPLKNKIKARMKREYFQSNPMFSNRYNSANNSLIFDTQKARPFERLIIDNYLMEVIDGIELLELKYSKTSYNVESISVNTIDVQFSGGFLKLVALSDLLNSTSTTIRSLNMDLQNPEDIKGTVSINIQGKMNNE